MNLKKLIRSPQGSSAKPATKSKLTDAQGNLDQNIGQLDKVAASIVMTVMYVARYARLDLYRACGHLSTYLTKWDSRCDEMLLRLMSYIQSSLDHGQIGYVGDSPDELRLALFVDADFAGCRATMKSATGVYLALVGPHTHYPLGFLSKKHSACAHSIVEAALIAADTGVRLEGIPAMELWKVILGCLLYTSPSPRD